MEAVLHICIRGLKFANGPKIGWLKGLGDDADPVGGGELVPDQGERNKGRGAGKRSEGVRGGGTITLNPQPFVPTEIFSGPQRPKPET